MLYVLLLLIAALAGVWRYRSAAYWKWVGFLTLWIIAFHTLFRAYGTLESPAGDGLITRHLRQSTDDGPMLALFLLVVMIVFFAVLLLALWKIWRAARAHIQAAKDSAEVAPNSAMRILRKFGETLALLVAAFFLAAFFVSGKGDRPDGGEGGTRAADAPSVRPGKIEARLARQAERLNAKLKKEKAETAGGNDGPLRLERVSAEGLIFTYHYRITDEAVTDEELEGFMDTVATPRLCGHSELSTLIREHGVTIRHSHMLPGRDEPVSFDIGREKCEEAGG